MMRQKKIINIVLIGIIIVILQFCSFAYSEYNFCLRPRLITNELNGLKKGKVGILPPGALNFAFFHYLGGDYIIAKGNSVSFEELKGEGYITLEVDGKHKIIDTREIFFQNLVTCYKNGGLPEVIIVAPLTDQLEVLVGDLIELLEELAKKGYLYNVSMLEQVLPIFVVASNGIFDRSIRKHIRNKIDNSDNLKDLTENIKEAIIGRIIRGIAIQGGERTTQVYRPGVKGSIHVAGGMSTARERVKQIFEAERGFSTFLHEDPEEEELKKAILSIAGNAVTLTYVLNKDGTFRDIRMGNLLEEPFKKYTEEICRAVYNISIKIGHFKGLSFDTVWENCLASIVHQYSRHRNSSIQLFIERLKKGSLKKELLPTESSLLDTLIQIAEKGSLENERKALIDLKNKILANFKIAIENRMRLIDEIYSATIDTHENIDDSEERIKIVSLTNSNYAGGYSKQVYDIAINMPYNTQADILRNRIDIESFAPISYAAVLGGEIVGYIMCSVGSQYVIIDFFGVKEEHRKKGIGTILLWNVATEVLKRNIPVFTVDVSMDDSTTLRFFYGKGFTRLVTEDTGMPEYPFYRLLADVPKVIQNLLSDRRFHDILAENENKKIDIFL